MKNSKMETFDRHNYFPLHVATFVLVLLSFLTAKEIIPNFILFLLIGGASIGFCISWYAADNKEVQKWITLVVNIFSLTITIWLIGVLLHTEFLYVPIIKGLLKALLAIELAFSLILFSSKSYNYIQISSIFLVLGSIAIKIGFDYQQPAIVILYISTYVITMRLRFLIDIKRDIKSFIGTKVRNGNIRNLISITSLFLVLLGLSWVLFIRISKVKPYPYAMGILPSKFIRPNAKEETSVGQAASFIEIQQDATQRFFDSKQKLSQELNKLIDKRQTTTYQKKKFLYFLLELLKKDAPIQKAQEEILKLKEFLTSSDLDLPQAERARLSNLADEYMRHKTEYELEQLNKALKEKLSVTHLNTGQRLAILWSFRQLKNTTQLATASRIVKEVYEKVEEDQLLMVVQKEDLKDIFNGLLSVKTNQTIMHIMGSLRNRIKGMSGLNRKGRNRLNETLSNIETDREMSLLREHFKETKSALKKLEVQGKISQDENNKMLRELEALHHAKTLQIVSGVTFNIMRKIDSIYQKPEPEAEKLKNELRKMQQAQSAEEFQKIFSKMKNMLEELKKQGAITSLDSNYIEFLLEELFQAKVEELAQRLEKEFAAALEKETRLTSFQRERLKDKLAQLKEAARKEEARETLEKISKELDRLREEGRLDYAPRKMLEQKAEELYQAKFPPETILEQLARAKTEELAQRLEKEFAAAFKDPFSSFSDKVKKLNISSASKDNLEILIKRLQESSNPVHVRQTMKDIDNWLESIKELTEISAWEKDVLKKTAEILARIKEEMIKASLVSPLIKKIEGLKNISREQKDELKDNLEQMVSKGDFEDLNKTYVEIMDKINEIKLLPKRTQEKHDIGVVFREGEKDELLKQDWKIEIIPSTILSYVGKPFQLKAIGIYKNSIIHDLTKEIIWKSENEDIVYIYKGGLSIPLAAGKVKIKAVWLDNISFEAKCIVTQKIPDQEIQWLNETVYK